MIILTLLLCLVLLTENAALAGSRAAAVSFDRVNLSEGFSFDEYINTGTAAQQEEIRNRVETIKFSAPYLAALQKIQKPIVLVAFASITCPDCARVVPYLEAIAKVNSLITTRYFPFNDSTKELLRERTQQARTPTVFLAARDGTLQKGAFVEYPRKVRRLVRDSFSKQERDGVIRDFRNGKYNIAIQEDLMKLLRK